MGASRRDTSSYQVCMDHIVCISSRNFGRGYARALGFNLCACRSLLWLLPTSFPRVDVLLGIPQRFPFPLASLHHPSPFSFQCYGWNSEPSTGKARALPLSVPIPPAPLFSFHSATLGSLLSQCSGEAGTLVSRNPGSKVKSEMLPALSPS